LDSDIILRLILYFGLLLMSGFFSGSETALFSLGPVQLVRFRKEGHPRASLIQSLLDQPRRLIATIFIGNEFVNIGASALMAAITNNALGQHGQVVVTIVSTAVSVALILFLGEITAKNLAMKMVEGWSSAAARPLWLLALLMAPLRWCIEKIADLVVFLVSRKDVADEPAGTVGEEEFLTMVDVGLEDGEIDAREQELIHNIFNFGDRRVTEVMTPATDVFALDSRLSQERIIAEVCANKYSRVPIYQGSRNRIVGLLYAKDLISQVHEISGRRRLQKLLHTAYFIPRSVTCGQLFKQFRKRMMHIAMVVNEYGHLVGVVTMEDLLEELFGEIRDEKEIGARGGGG